jgi:hypothetical protein
MNLSDHRHLLIRHENARLSGLALQILNEAKSSGIPVFVDPKKTTEAKIVFGERGSGSETLKGGKRTPSNEGKRVKLSSKFKEIVKAVAATKPDWVKVNNGNLLAITANEGESGKEEPKEETSEN